MRIKNIALAPAVIGGLMLCLGASLATAKVSQQEAQRLGKDLTPIGAEKAGNKAGTIPAWTGKVVTTMTADGFLKDPYPKDKPLYVITAKNMKKYSAQLTAGYKALLKAFPDTYKMPVYQTRRTSTYGQDVYKQAKANAVKAELANGGNGVVGAVGSVPFPIPKNGLEVVWNHLTRYKGGSLQFTSNIAPVQRNGNYTMIRLEDKLVFPDYLKDADSFDDDNVLFFFTRKAIAPARMTGTMLLVRETIDQVKEPRGAWTYNAGQRRVKRAPTIAYDGPAFASDGMKTSDDVDLYNGSPNRFNWKLEGKKEMLIAYNGYRIASRDVTFKDLLKPGHINQDTARYELHRVWKVVATLKEDSRHVYAKRVLYVDEDTWQVVHTENYDDRGNLWRVGEGHTVAYSNAEMNWFGLGVLYDLTAGRYIADWLMNEEPDPIDFSRTAKSRDFTPAALRRQGR